MPVWAPDELDALYEGSYSSLPTETYRGQRVQKFVYKGLAAITKKDQGVVWPKK